MVSGSKNAWPVPAYSLQSDYGKPNQPPQFKDWVKQYYDQLKYAIENQAPPLLQTVAEWDRLLLNDPEDLQNLKGEKEVEPMLISSWDQGQFYNQLCPSDPGGPSGHCYTGCVATAMGQLCCYFRWPNTGTGSYTYQHPDYGTLSADFGSTHYNWRAMTNSVVSQNSSVAELLFHLGVSVDMDYGPDGSGMWNHKAAYSLRTYFKYSPETEYLFRDSTTLNWDSVIIAHLDQKIPMYYAGWSVPNVNGHAFIVDGYQPGDYFHFNWGWSGSYDGYFYLDELIPGGSNFNLAQELIIHCYPDTLNYNYPLYCTGPDTLNWLSGTLDDGSGVLKDYQNNSGCSWLIDPQSIEDSVKYLKLTFNRFNTETTNDLVTVYDGENSTYPILGQFSGDTLPPMLTTTGNKAFITFTSNETVSDEGWFLSYESVLPVWCNGLTAITEPSGAIEDGSGPFYYHNGSLCMWNIQPPGATQLTLTFTGFDTEQGKDLVKIYDAGSSQLIATYSGTFEQGNLPDPVTSPSGKMMITFSTDGTITKQGWSADYSTPGVGIVTNDIDNSPVSIYPNPVSTILWLDFHNPKASVSDIRLYSASGQLFYTENYPNPVFSGKLHIDFSQIPAGVYFLQVNYSGYINYYKIIKSL